MVFSGVNIKQHYKYDCGAAALASIAAFYGKKLSIAKIRVLCGCTSQGISLKGVIDGAQKIGLQAKCYKSPNNDVSALQELKSPAIIHVKQEDYHHYMVLIECDNNHVKVMDPAIGRSLKLTHAQFTDIWSGYIILLSPNSKFYSQEENKSPLNRMYNLLKIAKREILLAFTGGIIITIIGVALTIFLQKVIDTVIPSNNTTAAVVISATIILLTLFTLYLNYKSTIYLIKGGVKIDTLIITSYIEKLLKLPLLFFKSTETGDLNARIMDSFAIRSFITGGILTIMVTIATILSAITIMFIYNSTMALIILISLPLYIGIFYISKEINKKYDHKIAISNAQFSSQLIESISAIETINHYSAERLIEDILGKRYLNFANNIYNGAIINNRLTTLNSSLTTSLNTIIFVVGTLFVIKEYLTIGQMVGFYTLTSFFAVPLSNLIETNKIISKSSIACKRVFEILDYNTEELNNNEEKIESITKGKNIEIKNLTFAYNGGKNVLEKLSIALKAGQITLIKGSSGCGKSTLAQLLMLDLTPCSGAIKYNGININNYHRDAWLSKISYIEQKPKLLNLTILENIILGDNNPDMKRLSKILIKVNLLTLIDKLPMGLLTKIGENGVNLSGGEVQKIAIARALYKESNIYILDEATSFLDKESKKSVALIVKELKSKGATIILISHNREDLELADNIITIN